MKRRWLYYFSPCIIALIVFVILMIAGCISLASSGYWILLVIYGWPALLVPPVADFYVKKSTDGDVKRIWVIESVIVAVIVLSYIIFLNG